MKKILLSILLSIVTLLAFATNPHIVNVQINTEESSIRWIGSKITESHDGTVNILKGSLDIDHGKLAGGLIAIDMNSISCTDIESEKYRLKLEKHLKDEDFFSVKEFPFAEIKILKAVKGKGDDYKILAELTIKGITHPVSFEANVKINGLDLYAKANIKIDRTKWDIRYGSGRFFENLGDRMIKDEIEFKVSLLSAS
jgi:polyisoprenoid-binding protein YceI